MRVQVPPPPITIPLCKNLINMCICINCDFYRTCWIKKGISKIPKNYVNLPFNFSFYFPLKTRSFNRQSLSIKIVLNKFTKQQKYEFDVTECEGFCEKPGNWILEKY